MELSKSDVVLSLAGRDQGMLFFVVDTDGLDSHIRRNPGM